MSDLTWIEPCAGTGAVAIRLVAGPTVDAAVTYQGGKRRYASAILAALGLRPGEGAARVVLCDAGTWGRAGGAMLNRHETATAIHTLRGWAAEKCEGRQLFERIVAEGQDEQSEGRWLAQFLALQDGAFGAKPVIALPGVGAAWRTPGYARAQRQSEGGETTEPKGFKWRLNPAGLARRLSRAASVPWPASTLVLRRDAATLDPHELRIVGRVVVYIDPPYAATTGYGPTLTRPQVVELARRFDAAGAIVAISEGDPVAELGWSTVDITAAHSGQPRTFTKSRREWLTVNREPVARLAVQPGLFEADPCLT